MAKICLLYFWSQIAKWMGLSRFGWFLLLMPYEKFDLMGDRIKNELALNVIHNLLDILGLGLAAFPFLHQTCTYTASILCAARFEFYVYTATAKLTGNYGLALDFFAGTQ